MPDFMDFIDPASPQPDLGRPPHIQMPVQALGYEVIDNGGFVVAKCPATEIAERIADLLNSDSREPL